MKVFMLASCFFIFSPSIYSQWSKQEICTDSSEIEIIRNSVYKITKEVYHYKDSIWYSVRYIKDTNQLKTEGWLNKNWNALGVWNEYRIDGVWMNKEENNPYKLTYNDSLYPHRSYLEQMKLSADYHIRKRMGTVFFEKNVKFNGSCYAYFNSAYVGSWMEPLEQKPNNFLFTYKINFNSIESLNQYIEVRLDSLGKFVVSDNHIFTKIPRKIRKKGFALNRDKMIKTFLRKNHIELKDKIVFEYTVCHNYRSKRKYNGYFTYNIVLKLEDKMETITHHNKTWSSPIYTYQVYEFNLWNGKLRKVFIENNYSDGINTTYPAHHKWSIIQLI